MIEIKSQKGNLSIPNAWGDLSEEQYLDVISLIYLEPVKNNSSMEMLEFRLKLLQILTDYKRSSKKYSPEDQEDINNLLSILATKISFVHRPYYADDELFEVMSDELGSALKNNFPYDLMGGAFDAEILQFHDLLHFSPAIHYNMKQNPLPILTLGKRFGRDVKIQGPIFNTDALGVAITNITAGEYVDAQEFYGLYNATKELRYLQMLSFVFYRNYPGTYDAAKSQQQLNQPLFAKTDPRFYLGFYHFFQNIQEYFFLHPVYGILYVRKEDKKETSKIRIGASESIYNASANGYGDVAKIKEYNLTDYMNLMVKDIKDGVARLRAYKKKDIEIANSLNIPLETIKQL